jgi:hypothetical protein
MGAANPTTHDAMLKELYPTPNEILRLMYENNTAFALMKKDFEGYGREWDLPVRIAHTAGRSHTYQNAKNNKAGTQVVQFKVSVGQNYSLYSVDGKLQRQTSNNKGAFVEAFEFELEGAMDAMNRNFGYEVYGNGGGSIGKISSGSNTGTATITLDNINDIVKFEKGQVLATSLTDGTSGSVKAGTVTVASVDRELGTITATGNWTAGIATAAASDFIFTDGDFGQGIKGFDAWIPATAPVVGGGDLFFGLDRSADPTRLAGSRVDLRTFGPEEQLQKACQVSTRNGGKLSHIFYNDIDFLNLDLALGSRRQYVDVKTDVGIGFSGIRVATGYGTVEVFADYNCKQGVGYGVDLKQWSLKGPGNFPFIDARDGGKILREDAADAFEGRVVGYYQMQCKKVAGSVRMQLT